MARIKGGMNAKKKHNRVLKLAKGYRGARSKQYRVAKQSVMRALTSSFAGRKEKKRQFRRFMWRNSPLHRTALTVSTPVAILQITIWRNFTQQM